jgi:hypothetical protein
MDVVECDGGDAMEPAIERGKQMEDAWKRGYITSMEYHAWLRSQINALAADEIREAIARGRYA